jgi:hypothetical protein
MEVFGFLIFAFFSSTYVNAMSVVSDNATLPSAGSVLGFTPSQCKHFSDLDCRHMQQLV